MKKKTNNILALVTCSFIIFASFWCMNHPQVTMRNGLANVLADEGIVKLNPGSWDLDGDEGLQIEGNETGVDSKDGQKIYASENEGIMGFLNHTVDFALLTIGSLAILGVIVGGMLMIIGSMKGNTEGVESGKNAVVYSLIGLALVFLSYFIVSVTQTILYS